MARIKLAAVLLLLGGALPAAAHHSFAIFDHTRTYTLKGTVRSFQWTNPHCYIQLMVKDAAGKQTEWSLEMGAPMYLYAKGWRPSSLKAGAQISVTINPLRNGDPGGIVLTATADGKQIGKSLARTS